MGEEQVPHDGWRVRSPTGELGPVDLEALRTWIREDRVKPDDLVCHEPSKAFVRAANVRELAGLFSKEALEAASSLESRRPGANRVIIAAVVVAVVVVLVLVIALALPRMAASREEARRLKCMSRVRWLGLGIKQYSGDYGDVCPWRVGAPDPGEAWRDLGLLYPDYTAKPNEFFCPSSRDHSFLKKTMPGQVPQPFAAGNSRAVISYAYGFDSQEKPARPWTEMARSSVRLLADKKAGVALTRRSNHKLGGRAVLCNELYVYWHSSEGPCDPEEGEDAVGAPGAPDYTDWWSDPPYYGE